MTATACRPPAIPEHVAVGLWARRSHLCERERVLAFCSDLVTALRDGRVPALPRTPLAELEIGLMAYNALRRAGFSYLDEIEMLGATQLMRFRQIGEHTAAEITEAVRRHRRRMAREQQAAAGETFTPLEPLPVEGLQEQAQGLIQAFYACTEDQERMAALLIRAADVAQAQGPGQLRSLAMALLELPA